jgi:hypothetical protein
MLLFVFLIVAKTWCVRAHMISQQVFVYRLDAEYHGTGSPKNSGRTLESHKLVISKNNLLPVAAVTLISTCREDTSHDMTSVTLEPRPKPTPSSRSKPPPLLVESPKSWLTARQKLGRVSQ